MPATLHPRTERLLATLPPFLAGSYEMRAALDAQMRELDRFETAMNAVRANFTPQTADTLLSWYETQLGLPVAPSGRTVAQRRTTVLANLDGLKGSGSGLSWEATLGRLLEGAPWSYREHRAEPEKNYIADPRGASGAHWESIWVPGSGYLAPTAVSDPDLGGFGIEATLPAQAAPVEWETLRQLSTEPSATVPVGRFYGVRATVKITAAFPAGSSPIRLNLVLRYPDGSERATSAVAESPLTADAYAVGTVLNLAGVGQHDTADATMVGLSISVPTVPAGGTPIVRVGRMMVTRVAGLDAAVPPYFDGTMGGVATWDGTPDHSLSSLLQPAAGHVEVTMPFAANSPQAGAFEAFARRITPEHLVLDFKYKGFVLGTSQLGVDPL